MDPSTFNTIAGISSIVGVIGTFVGLVSWLYERRTRRRMEIENQRRIWSDYSKIVGLMSDLEKDVGRSPENCQGALQAIGKLSFMLRDLLREAALAETDFSDTTIKKWRSVGKLGSDWQERLAFMLLSTEEIGSSDSQQLEVFKNWDELPFTHPVQARNRELSKLENLPPVTIAHLTDRETGTGRKKDND